MRQTNLRQLKSYKTLLFLIFSRVPFVSSSLPTHAGRLQHLARPHSK